MQLNTETLIIGAGLSGLSAAQTLVRSGRSVLVVDKGRGVGGRLATRRIGDATLDHGAQFFTCLLYTSPSPRDKRQSRMPSSA